MDLHRGLHWTRHVAARVDANAPRARELTNEPYCSASVALRELRVQAEFQGFTAVSSHFALTARLIDSHRSKGWKTHDMSPTDYEYLFILDALERKEPIFPFIVKALSESGLVDVSEQGISLTPAGMSLMQQIAEKETDAPNH
jgi:hypothetical protein